MNSIFRKKHHQIIVFIVIAIFILTGCSIKSDDDNSGTYGSATEITKKVMGSISLFTTEVDSLNPLKTKNYYMTAFLGIVYEGLVKNNAKFDATPLLAESWTSSNQNKKWDFKLKKGIKWHNNTDFSIEDVIQTVRHISSSNYNGQYKQLLFGLKAVNKVDANTISFILNRSDPVFDSKMIFPIMNSNDIKFNMKSIKFKPIGTGPYKFRSTKDGRILLDRNTSYHDAMPFIKSIELKKYNSPNAALGGFLRGEIDVFLSSNYSSVAEIKNGYNLFDSFSNNFDFLQINTNNSLLKNEGLRKAMALAINKKSLVNMFFKNDAQAINLPNILDNRFDSSFAYQLDLARDFLSNSKWDSKNKLEIIVSKFDLKKGLVAEEIQKSLLVIGIETKINKLTSNDVRNRISSGNYQIALIGYSAPSNKDFRFLTNQFQNDTFAKQVYSWAVDSNLETRITKYNDLIPEIAALNPFITLYQFKRTILSNRRIIGTLSSDERFPYNSIAECSVSY